MFNCVPSLIPFRPYSDYEFQSDLALLGSRRFSGSNFSTPWNVWSFGSNSYGAGLSFNSRHSFTPWSFNSNNTLRLPNPWDRGSLWNFGALTRKTTPVGRNDYNPKNSFRPYDYNKYDKNGDKIKELDPKMQEKVMQLLDYAKQQGIKGVKIISGYRTYQEQAALYQKYVVEGGQKGRAAKPGTSKHETGKAIDINAEQLNYADVQKLAKYAKEVLGMNWGGDFKTCREIWHFDII